MKKLLIILFTCLAVSSNSQNLSNTNYYSDIYARVEHAFKIRPHVDYTSKYFDDYWDNDKLNPYANAVIDYGFVIDLRDYVNPVKTKTVNSNFGYRSSRRHQGVDLKGAMGDTIYASFDGKVRMSKYNRHGYGFYVIIRHKNGIETLYAHLSRFLVKENEFVKGGQPIGLVGSTGRSTGPHLHYEIRYMGRAINPRKLIDFETHIPLSAHVKVHRKIFD